MTRVVCAIVDARCAAPTTVQPSAVAAETRIEAGGRDVADWTRSDGGADGGLTLREDDALIPALPVTTDERETWNLGDAAWCATVDGAAEVCRGGDGILRAPCNDSGQCADRLVPIHRVKGVACARAPNNVRAPTAAREQLCTFTTRGGQEITARCSLSAPGADGALPSEGCEDTNADPYARRARGNVRRCWNVSAPRELDPSIYVKPRRRYAYTALCSTAGKNLYACHATIEVLGFATAGDPVPPAPSLFTCDSRKLNPADVVDCADVDPNLRACTLAYDPAVTALCQLVPGDPAPRHCVEQPPAGEYDGICLPQEAASLRATVVGLSTAGRGLTADASLPKASKEERALVRAIRDRPELIDCLGDYGSVATVTMVLGHDGVPVWTAIDDFGIGIAPSAPLAQQIAAAHVDVAAAQDEGHVNVVVAVDPLGSHPMMPVVFPEGPAVFDIQDPPRRGFIEGIYDSGGEGGIDPLVATQVQTALLYPYDLGLARRGRDHALQAALTGGSPAEPPLGLDERIQPPGAPALDRRRQFRNCLVRRLGTTDLTTPRRRTQLFEAVDHCLRELGLRRLSREDYAEWSQRILEWLASRPPETCARIPATPRKPGGGGSGGGFFGRLGGCYGRLAGSTSAP